MLKTKGKKAKKVKRTAHAAVRKTKKVLAKTNTAKMKNKAKKMLGNAKKKLKDLTKKSAKNLSYAKDKVHVAEEEISKYVKENPIKSLSVVALTGLIAGFLARSKK